MATIPSNFNRLQPSSQFSWLDPGATMTTASARRPATNRRTASDYPSILRSLAKEPEDAGLTGGTRSLDRRLLALNFAEMPAKVEARSERPNLPRRPAAA